MSLTPAQFGMLLAVKGEPVVWMANGGQTATVMADWVTLAQLATLDEALGGAAMRNVRAIVQHMKGREPIVNAYGTAGRSVQFAAGDLPRPPQQYDVVEAMDGERVTLHAIVPKYDVRSGRVVSYTCHGRGV